MIAQRNLTSRQVFVTYALADRPLADRVIDSLKGAGLKVVGAQSVSMDGTYDDKVRTALEGSDAVVIALSAVPEGVSLPSTVLFELGAAIAAGKPIYLVVNDATATFPFRVPHLRVLPASRMDEIGREIIDHAA